MLVEQYTFVGGEEQQPFDWNVCNIYAVAFYIALLDILCVSP